MINWHCLPQAPSARPQTNPSWPRSTHRSFSSPGQCGFVQTATGTGALEPQRRVPGGMEKTQVSHEQPWYWTAIYRRGNLCRATSLQFHATGLTNSRSHGMVVGTMYPSIAMAQCNPSEPPRPLDQTKQPTKNHSPKL